MQEYVGEIDYGQSLRQMIKDGNYARVVNDITSKYFPTKGKG